MFSTCLFLPHEFFIRGNWNARYLLQKNLRSMNTCMKNRSSPFILSWQRGAPLVIYSTWSQIHVICTYLTKSCTLWILTWQRPTSYVYLRVKELYSLKTYMTKNFTLEYLLDREMHICILPWQRAALYDYQTYLIKSYTFQILNKWRNSPTQYLLYAEPHPWNLFDTKQKFLYTSWQWAAPLNSDLTKTRILEYLLDKGCHPVYWLNILTMSCNPGYTYLIKCRTLNIYKISCRTPECLLDKELHLWIHAWQRVATFNTDLSKSCTPECFLDKELRPWDWLYKELHPWILTWQRAAPLNTYLTKICPSEYLFDKERHPWILT